MQRTGCESNPPPLRYDSLPLEQLHCAVVHQLTTLRRIILTLRRLHRHKNEQLGELAIHNRVPITKPLMRPSPVLRNPKVPTR